MFWTLPDWVNFEKYRLFLLTQSRITTAIGTGIQLNKFSSFTCILASNASEAAAVSSISVIYYSNVTLVPSYDLHQSYDLGPHLNDNSVSDF